MLTNITRFLTDPLDLYKFDSGCPDVSKCIICYVYVLMVAITLLLVDCRFFLAALFCSNLSVLWWILYASCSYRITSSYHFTMIFSPPIFNPERVSFLHSSVVGSVAIHLLPTSDVHPPRTETASYCNDVTWLPVAASMISLTSQWLYVHPGSLRLKQTDLGLLGGSSRLIVMAGNSRLS